MISIPVGEKLLKEVLSEKKNNIGQKPGST